MKLRYTDRSKDDVELAFAWYERQRRGLGFEFLDCVEVPLTFTRVLNVRHLYLALYLISLIKYPIGYFISTIVIINNTL